MLPVAIATADAVSLFRRHRVFWLAVAAFVTSAVLINPLRETALEDDWVYSLIVKRLLETGQYQLHDWSAANMPFQAFWGALFATIGGYSFGVLRVSTLALALIGLVAFYGLARYHALDREAAGVAMLAMFASPVVFRFSYTFDTDIPFLGCWLVALLGFTAGIARGRVSYMVLGGAAGAAAILTRQFGVALIPALAGVWILDPQRRARLPLYCLGIVPLLGAAAWQLWAGLAAPNWGAVFVRTAQARYLSQPDQVLLHLLWRPAVALQYLALFTVALLPAAVVTLFTAVRHGPPRARSAGATRDRFFLALLAAYLVGAIVLGAVGLQMPWLMPYIPWSLARVSGSLLASGALTAVTFAGALVLGRVLYLRYAGTDRPAAPHEWLIDLATFFLLAQHLVLNKMGDRYLISFTPLALVALVRYLRGYLKVRLSRAVFSCFVVLAGSVVWTRGILSYQEARWQAAESGRSAGISPALIYGPWTWVFYYRASEYLADLQGRIPDNLGYSMFSDWLPLQEQRAEYHVVVSRTPLSGGGEWEVKADVPFRDIIFRASHAYLVQRLASPAALDKGFSPRQ